jgi:hypothetical protein
MFKLDSTQLPLFLIRLSLAFVFLYAGLASLMRPNDWIGYIPSYLPQIFPKSTELILFSGFEIALSGWLLTGWKLFYSSLLSTLVLIGITILNLSLFDVTFRDVALAGVSLALTLSAKKSR